jgi:hypothetical protein
VTRWTVSRAVTPALTAHGVRHIFGIPGGKIFEIYDALADAVEADELPQLPPSSDDDHVELPGGGERDYLA